MAQLPLNTFKTKTALLTANPGTTVYTAPIGTTAIILMAQVANISTQTHYVNFGHFRNRPILADAQGNGGQGGNITTELVSQFQIPPNDSANMLPGKMIIESLDSVVCYSDTEQYMKLVLSILETANQ